MTVVELKKEDSRKLSYSEGFSLIIVIATASVIIEIKALLKQSSFNFLLQFQSLLHCDLNCL